MPLSLLEVDVGLSAGDGQGDPGRTAFQKVNYNAAVIAGAMEDAEVKAFTIGCTAKGEDVAVADDVEHFHMPYSFVLLEVQAGVETAPVGSSLDIDVLEDGYSVLDSGGLSIPADDDFATAEAAEHTILNKGAKVTINVNQVGSTTPGQWLKVSLVGYVIWTSF